MEETNQILSFCGQHLARGPYVVHAFPREFVITYNHENMSTSFPLTFCYEQWGKKKESNADIHFEIFSSVCDGNDDIFLYSFNVTCLIHRLFHNIAVLFCLFFITHLFEALWIEKQAKAAAVRPVMA